MNYITTAALTALFAVLMGWLPISSYMEPQQDNAHSRFEKAAIEICGPNAAFADLGDGVIQCLQHTGRKAARKEIK